MRRPLAIETVGRLLFATRWLLAPFYAGLALGLVLLLSTFAVSLVGLLRHVGTGNPDTVMVGVLRLADISLAANLVLIVMFAGWENFVGRLDLGDHPDRPSWLGRIGFGELKLKLVASIVAIAAVHVLEDFVEVPHFTDRQLAWRAGLLLVFVTSGVLLALMDRLAAGTPEG